MSYKTELQANNAELKELLSMVDELPEGESRSPMPIEVSTEAAMSAILASATSKDVGAIYKYTGKKSATYKYGALYIIEEESE